MEGITMPLNHALTLIFLACCILLCVNHAQADVMCLAGNFLVGSQGFVRCDFGKDVTKDKVDFNVVWYAFNDTNYEYRKNLLACSWHNGQMTCPLKVPGYLFDNRVDSTLTLVIPVVDKSMAGLYRCQLVPKPPDTEMHFCSMTVTDPPTTTTTEAPTTQSSPVTPGHPNVNTAMPGNPKELPASPGTPQNPASLETTSTPVTSPSTDGTNDTIIIDKETEGSGGVATGVIIGVVVAVVIAVAVVVGLLIGFWCVKKRKRCGKRQGTENGVEQGKDDSRHSGENKLLLAHIDETTCDRAETTNTGTETIEVDENLTVDVGDSDLDGNVSRELGGDRDESKVNESTQPQVPPSTNINTDNTTCKSEIPNAQSNVNAGKENEEAAGAAGYKAVGKGDKHTPPSVTPTTTNAKIDATNTSQVSQQDTHLTGEDNIIVPDNRHSFRPAEEVEADKRLDKANTDLNRRSETKVENVEFEDKGEYVKGVRDQFERQISEQEATTSKQHVHRQTSQSDPHAPGEKVNKPDNKPAEEASASGEADTPLNNVTFKIDETFPETENSNSSSESNDDKTDEEVEDHGVKALIKKRADSKKE